MAEDNRAELLEELVYLWEIIILILMVIYYTTKPMHVRIINQFYYSYLCAEEE